ncbi:MAG: DUF4982 domain-containing protein [Treponema sp.]|nr:DUF4982 domain-containing protein [Treponema sp.]
MEKINLDEKWTFRRGLLDSLGVIDSNPGEIVNLPHDGIISLPVTKSAPAVTDSGYFPGDVCNYTKNIYVPEEWKDDCIALKFDGAMMHTSIDVNGCKVGEHHYGYSPFYVDITDYVTYGAENRITVNLNTGVQPSCRWYTGSGLFRSVFLCHSPKVHIKDDGVYLFTKEISEDKTLAFLEAQIDIENPTLENHMVKVEIDLIDSEGKISACAKQTIFVNKQDCNTANLAFSVKNPVLWDCDNPNLYTVKVTATDTGIYRTHFVESKIQTIDKAETIFGIRTICVDAVRGLRINGKTTKLKGGCVHHDNGLLGAVSLYESEARKVRKLKSVGFNAIRTAHNPPSAALVEACDKEGLYIFDEAFDAWGIAKRTGDYSQYFSKYWQSDLEAFVRRDRIHPSVIMWSTGNEIPERGGINNGYTISTQLALTIKALDKSRPVSNGICSLWAGLDDELARNQNQNQNAKDKVENLWETVTEPFTNGLDVVGYNYMEDLYEKDHELFPQRVMLGSENFPQQVGFRWPLVEKLPYVIGEFTWTAWDYLGEAGIGKAVYVDKNDPLVQKGSWSLMPPSGSPFPWRLANDADFDINGNLLAQGAYRSVVFGSDKTHLYSFDPQFFGKIEMITLWGFPAVTKNWNYGDYENQMVELLVFTKADEVELYVNGKLIERKSVSRQFPMPDSVRFETKFVPGVVEAVSYKDGKEISRDKLVTSGEPAKLQVTAEKIKLSADGHDVSYVNIQIVDENNNPVTDSQIELVAELTGEKDTAVLSAFGTGNPVTEENYTDNKTVTFRGKATAVIRSGYKKGEAELKIYAKSENLAPVTVKLQVE